MRELLLEKAHQHLSTDFASYDEVASFAFRSNILPLLNEYLYDITDAAIDRFLVAYLDKSTAGYRHSFLMCFLKRKNDLCFQCNSMGGKCGE